MRSNITHKLGTDQSTEFVFQCSGLLQMQDSCKKRIQFPENSVRAEHCQTQWQRQFEILNVKKI